MESIATKFDHSWRALLRPGDAGDYFAQARHLPFAPDAAGYHALNAWWLAELARLIYRDDTPDGPTRNALLAQAGLRERAFFSCRNTRGALVESVAGTPFAVLVFRGTSALRDWLTNLNIVPLRWAGGGWVHQGFAEALDSVWPEIAAALRQIEGRPLFYTGHSLGAALATLAAARHPPQAVYTFGSPRVGEAEFARTLAGVPLWRVVNQCDLVPTMPLPGPLGFRHVGELRYITHNQRLLVKPSQRRILADWLGNRPDLAALMDFEHWREPVRCLAAHAPINYVTPLARLAGKIAGATAALS